MKGEVPAVGNGKLPDGGHGITLKRKPLLGQKGFPNAMAVACLHSGIFDVSTQTIRYLARALLIKNCPAGYQRNAPRIVEIIRNVSGENWAIENQEVPDNQV